MCTCFVESGSNASTIIPMLGKSRYGVNNDDQRLHRILLTGNIIARNSERKVGEANVGRFRWWRKERRTIGEPYEHNVYDKWSSLRGHIQQNEHLWMLQLQSLGQGNTTLCRIWTGGSKRLGKLARALTPWTPRPDSSTASRPVTAYRLLYLYHCIYLYHSLGKPIPPVLSRGESAAR